MLMQFQEPLLHTVSLTRAGEWVTGLQSLFHFMQQRLTADGYLRSQAKHTGFLLKPNGNMPAGRFCRSVFL